MYLNLKAEIFRKGWTLHYLAELLGMTDSQLSNKVSGKTKFTLIEAIRIKELLEVDIPIEILFARAS